jgi:hypothetical protein
MHRLLAALALALAAAPTAAAGAWTPPDGHCLLGARETPMILQAAALVAPLGILPERMSAPCTAVAEAHADGRPMLTAVPILVFGRPAMLDEAPGPMGPDDVRRWTQAFLPNAEASILDAWPEATAADIDAWHAAMTRGDGTALAQALEARAAATPPARSYAVLLAAGEDEMRFLVEDPKRGLRLGVRVHLFQDRMAWTAVVTPGLPNPHPLAEILALLDAEAAANR